MFRGRDNPLIVNHEMNDGLIFMLQFGRNRVEADCASFPIPRKYIVTNLDFADCPLQERTSGTYKIRAGILDNAGSWSYTNWYAIEPDS